MTTLTIGKVAQRAGVGIETVRFYEREALIDEPPRGPSGYRHYPESVVPRLLFIKRAKELGFTLNEVKDLRGTRPAGTKPMSSNKLRSGWRGMLAALPAVGVALVPRFT